MTDDRKEKVKKDGKLIDAALKDVFGHGEDFRNKASILIGGKRLSVSYKPDPGRVYLSFTFSGDGPQDSSEKEGETSLDIVGKNLQTGTKDFFDSLRIFTHRLSQDGIGVEYHAEDRRARLYSKILESTGFKPLPGNPMDPGLKSWGPVVGNLSSGSPMLARLAALEKRVKGLRDLPEPKTAAIQVSDQREASPPAQLPAQQTATPRLPQGNSERLESVRDLPAVPTPSAPSQTSSTPLQDDSPTARAMRGLPALFRPLEPDPRTVSSSQSAPDSPSVSTAPAPAPTAATAVPDGTRPIRDLPVAVQTPVPAPAAVSPATTTPTVPAPTAALETVRAAQAIRSLPPAPGRRGEAGRAGGAGLPGATGIPGVSGAVGASSLGGSVGESGAAGLPGLPGSPGATALSKAFSWQVTSEQREGSEQLIAAIKELTQALKEKRDDREPGIQPDGSFIPAGPGAAPKKEEKDKGMFMGPWMPGFLRGLRS